MSKTRGVASFGVPLKTRERISTLNRYLWRAAALCEAAQIAQQLRKCECTAYEMYTCVH